MSYTPETIKQNVKQSWLDVMEPSFKKKEFQEVLAKINSCTEKFNVFPPPDLLLSAFTHFDVKETKVCLLGMDPYIRPGQAMGLSFSVPRGIPVPPSLRNIYKEISSNDSEFEVPDHGDLTRWVSEENVLLLNAALTVREGKSGSHSKRWSNFTDRIIQHLSDSTEGVVFILLGNNAKQKSKLIDKEKHCVVAGVHPSPLSAFRGFFGSRVFQQTNECLVEMGREPVNWRV